MSTFFLQVNKNPNRLLYHTLLSVYDMSVKARQFFIKQNSKQKETGSGN